MSGNTLKNEILKLIVNTDDEEILSLVKEELVEYKSKSAGYDITDELNEEDFSHLKQLAEEDPLKNTIGFEEMQHKVSQWRLK